MIGCFINGSFVGILGGVLIDEKKHIGAVIPFLALPLFIVAGFFQNVKEMAWPLRVISYISPFRYTY